MQWSNWKKKSVFTVKLGNAFVKCTVINRDSFPIIEASNLSTVLSDSPAWVTLIKFQYDYTLAFMYKSWQLWKMWWSENLPFVKRFMVSLAFQFECNDFSIAGAYPEVFVGVQTQVIRVTPLKLISFEPIFKLHYSLFWIIFLILILFSFLFSWFFFWGGGGAGVVATPLPLLHYVPVSVWFPVSYSHSASPNWL